MDITGVSHHSPPRIPPPAFPAPGTKSTEMRCPQGMRAEHLSPVILGCSKPHVWLLARAVLLESPNPAALGTVPCCHTSLPRGRTWSCSLAGWIRLPCLDLIPADLEPGLGKGWEARGREAVSLPMLPVPPPPSSPSIALGRCGTERELLMAAAPPGHPGVAPREPHLQQIFAQHLGLLGSARQERGEPIGEGSGTCSSALCTPRTPGCAFPPGCRGDLRMSAPTSHCLIS